MASRAADAGRTLVALTLPTIAISYAWASLGRPDRVAAFVAVCVLAVIPAVVRWQAWRVVVVDVTVVLAFALAFRLPLWEALPYRDQEVFRPLQDALITGLGDAFNVGPPFVTGRHPELEALTLFATFGFVSATGLLIAARRPLAAAALTVLGVGWPATLLDSEAAGLGALGLAAALSIPLALRARSLAGGVGGLGVGAAVVLVAASASSAATFSRSALLDWEQWDFRGASARALGVRFVWNANYDGISFPKTKTTVLRIEGPKRYWRASTLSIFTSDRWLEERSVLALGDAEGNVPTETLTPPAALDERNWREAKITVKALVDDHLVSAGTPVRLDAPRLDSLFFLAGGAIRSRHPLGSGTTYRVWSYAPEPAPAALERAGTRYPTTVAPYLEVSARALPVFGSPQRDSALETELARASFPTIRPYAPVYELAQRVTDGSKTPYEAVLSVESWLRAGSFRYAEQPPHSSGPPLVAFLTSTRAGYCQHFAGSMALMLRLLGIPSRVVVGFTGGVFDKGAWTITDHDAHAWVEAWFPRIGWVPFDPTPGRGTLSGQYTYASDSARAVDRLGARDFRAADDLDPVPPIPSPTTSPGSGAGAKPFVLLGLLALVLGVGAIGLGKDVRRRARYAGSDPRAIATAGRRDLEAFLRDQGVVVPASTTLGDLAGIVKSELGLDASRFSAAASRARFGRQHDAVESAGMARHELGVLLERARASLSRRDRVRGFVSLRSILAGRAR